MQGSHIRWWTPHLSREFEMLVFGHGGGLPLILFPTSFGRYHQTKDFGLVDAVSGAFDISDIFGGYHDDNVYFNSPYEIPAKHA